MDSRNTNILTSGSLLAGLWALAWPMFVSAVLQNAQSLIDLFWVGRLGTDAVAALAIGGTLTMTLFPVVMGVCVGTLAFVSRNVGAGRYDEANAAAGQSLLLGLILGLAAGITAGTFAQPLCRLLGARGEVLRLGSDYLRIVFAGSFTVFLLFAGGSVLRGAGNAVVPMLAMLLANILNAVLDPIMIYGLLGFPRLEVAGAALATVVSQGVAAMFILGIIAKGVAHLRVPLTQWKLRGALAVRILRVGLPSSAQMLSRSLMSLVLMRIVALCGMAAVAAYGIGLRIHTLILLPTFAIGDAAATMVGQNLGAGQPGRARRAAWLATLTATALIAVTATALFIFAPQMPMIFDRSTIVVESGTAYLRIVSPFYVFAALSIVLGRAQMGAGETVPPMLCTILSLWGIQVPFAAWWSRQFDPPTNGIWWAIALALLVNALLTTLWFQMGRWQKKQL